MHRLVSPQHLFCKIAIFLFLQASKPPAPKPPSFQSASAGDAKRKQSARPSGGWAKACWGVRVTRRGQSPTWPFVRRLFSLTFLSKRLFFGLSRDPKIDPKPPSGLKVGSPSRFFIHVVAFPVFLCFFTRFGTNFRWFFDVFFHAFLDDPVVFFQTAEPSNSSPWTVFRALSSFFTFLFFY